MQFLAIPFVALLATSALALPGQLEARQPFGSGEDISCKAKMPACGGGSVVGHVLCPCNSLNANSDGKCDLWTCPSDYDAEANVVSFLTRILVLSYIKMYTDFY
ncbi:signal peptide-containing protein [Rutstroemia sp. NJR-2017a BBW]|nr:signal peptide-containing protein [Rutstroemia sp. NJR-2017a BBW]